MMTFKLKLYEESVSDNTGKPNTGMIVGSEISYDHILKCLKDYKSVLKGKEDISTINHHISVDRASGMLVTTFDVKDARLLTNIIEEISNHNSKNEKHVSHKLNDIFRHWGVF